MQRNYAAMTKVRAMYGRHLTPGDYEAMMQKKSVGELAGYLKRETGYGPLLAEVREELVHRGQLEYLIRRRKLDIYLRLARYSHANDTFLRVFITRSEIDQLLTALRAVDMDGMSGLAASFPAYLAKYMSFDLYRLAEVQNFDELLAVLEHTPYHNLLLPLRGTPEHQIDIPACEKALLTAYYQKVLALVDSRYAGETRKAMRQLLLSQVDLHNLTVIYRMKRYWTGSPQEIADKLIHLELPTGIKRKTYDSLLEASDASTVLVRLKSVPMLQKFLGEPGMDIEHVLDHYRQEKSRRIFRFSQMPIVVILCYMNLLDIEGDNIVNIIEGIRYRLPPEEIRKLLVY